MHNLFKRNKKYLLLVFSLIIIGLFLGFIYYYYLDSSAKDNIAITISNYNGFKQNYVLKDLLIMSLLLVTSFLIIGMPLTFIYILYESMSLGFLCPVFYYTYGVKGLVYILLFIIINKCLTFIFKLSFIKRLFNISRSVLGLIINKKDEFLRKRIINNFKKSLYLLLIVFFINILLFFISPQIFAKLSFLLYNKSH